MAQMLPMIQIVPNMNLALDPVSGVIGASLGEGVILLSMDEINNEVTKLQGAADELVSSYGFVLAIIIIFAALPILIKLGVL